MRVQGSEEGTIKTDPRKERRPEIQLLCSLKQESLDNFTEPDTNVSLYESPVLELQPGCEMDVFTVYSWGDVW